MPSNKSKNVSQINKFKESARALECDESEATFDKKLKGIASVKPKPQEAAPKKKR